MVAVETRQSMAQDISALEEIYPSAFVDEDLLPVVRDLLDEGPSVLSLVAIAESTLAGHVMFTACSVGGEADKVSLLGPLAVAPVWQRQGVGSALVHEGLRRLQTEGIDWVYVLGDPAYYGRFGFQADAGVAPPYPLPEEWSGAWQSLSLSGAKPFQGQLCVPPPWRQRALWVS